MACGCLHPLLDSLSPPPLAPLPNTSKTSLAPIQPLQFYLKTTTKQPKTPLCIPQSRLLSRSPAPPPNADDRLRAAAMALQDCASRRSLLGGKAIHARLLRSGTEPDTFLHDCLLNLYCKCGSIADARKLLDEMPHRDVVAWTAMVAGYNAVGDAGEGMKLFADMQKEGILPNGFALAVALKASSVSPDLDFARQVHAQVIKMHFLSDSYVGSSLVEAYVRCGEMELAERAFLDLPEYNDVTWNALFSGYYQEGHYEKILLVFKKLMESDAKFSKYTLPTVIKCCVELGLARLGQAVHALVMKGGLETDSVLCSCLIDMYSKCLSVEDAYEVFVRINEPDVVDCSAMISCFDRHDMASEALNLFVEMRNMGVELNQYTFVSIASVASKSGDLNLCRSVHAYILKSGYALEKEVGDAILNMYMKNGAVKDGRMVFDAMLEHDTFSWNILLSGFHSGSNCEQGPRIFNQMVCESFAANKYTYVSILRACTSLMDWKYGSQIHAHTLKSSLEGDPHVARALLDMYANCGCFTSARVVFDGLKERDVFSWTLIISGYAKNDQGEKAIEYFRRMLQENASPNDATLASCLSACSDLASLSCGLQLHSWTIKSGWNNAVVSSALVDMYVKCGSIMDAEELFYGSESSVTRDKVLWNTIICGYSHYGQGSKALKAFEQMIEEGNTPDEITFIGILSACSHAGLLDEGLKYFNSLNDVYGISPTSEHHACMVDILAKAGKLDEAESFINQMELNPDASIWKTILGACRIHGNIEIAERAATKLFEFEPQLESSYILLSNIYADLRRWGDVARVRSMLSDRGVKKEPGCSWIEIDGEIHVFLAQDGRTRC